MKDVSRWLPEDPEGEYPTKSLIWVRDHMNKVVYADDTMEYGIHRWEHYYVGRDPQLHHVKIHFSCLKDNPAGISPFSRKVVLGADVIIDEFVIEADAKEYFFQEIYSSLRKIEMQWFDKRFQLRHPRVVDAYLPFDQAIKEWAAVPKNPMRVKQ